MATKEWTYETFPKHKPIYIRRKGMPHGCSMIVNIAPLGASIAITRNEKPVMQALTWRDLFMTCIQYDGSICGVKG